MIFGAKCDKERTCIELVETRLELNLIFVFGENLIFEPVNFEFCKQYFFRRSRKQSVLDN